MNSNNQYFIKTRSLIKSTRVTMSMKKVVIISSKDPAGITIKNSLEALGYTETIVKDKNIINLEDIDKEIDADIFIFASKHRSKSEIPALTIHATGNWGTANKEFGGKTKKLNLCAASYIREGFLKIRELNTIGYDVLIEATHHGPFIEKPCFFIEIGSTEKEWNNKEAGVIIAKTILHLLNTEPKDFTTVFGIGGLHTTPILSHCIDKGYALGHVCPKYMLNILDKEMIQQALQQSTPKSQTVLLDWKGIGKDKNKILKMLKEINCKVLRSDKLENK